jgi:hypothetical protein
MQAIDRIRKELGANLEEVQCAEYDDVKHLYPIRALPAIIFLREDLQGENLLDIDPETTSLRLSLEAAQALEAEERNLQEYETYRLDFKMKQKIETATEPLGTELVATKLQERQATATANSLGAQLITTKLELAKYKNEEETA